MARSFVGTGVKLCAGLIVLIAAIAVALNWPVRPRAVAVHATAKRTSTNAAITAAPSGAIAVDSNVAAAAAAPALPIAEAIADAPFATAPTAVPTQTPSTALEPPAALVVSSPPQAQLDAPILNQYEFRFEQPFREIIQSLTIAPQPAHLQFPVSNSRTLDLVITRHDQQDTNQGVVFARIADAAPTRIVLAYVNEAVAGTIVTPEGEVFQVRYAGNGVQRVVQLDPSQFPLDADPLAPPVTAPRQALAPVAGATQRDVPAVARRGAEGDEPGVAFFGGATSLDVPATPSDMLSTQSRDGVNTILDLIVVYTTQSRVNNGGVSGMNALINASVASANLAHANSATGILLRLVYTAEEAYVSTGQLALDLAALKNPSDGNMDDVFQMRTQYNADLVSLFVPPSQDGYVGIAYLLNPNTQGAGIYDWAFTTVVDIYADSNLTLAHEIGHNLGASHAANDPGAGGVYPDSYGYRFTVGGTTYRTVMAYAPGIRIPYFSSPSVTYLGVPVGSSAANNAATLVRDKVAVASSRMGTADWTVAAGADLNDDGKPDLVWRNVLTNREIAWLMDGATRTSVPTLWTPAPSDPNWTVMTSGDFNGDGRPDLVWRNTTSGRVIVWFMNGVTQIGTAALWPATNPGDSDWVPIAAADFNADGQCDLVWRNSTNGRVIVWFLNGVTTVGTAAIWPATSPGDSAWIPMAAGDFNGDGKPDLIWRQSTTGRVIVWYMDGVTRMGTAAIWPATNPGDSAWRPMATGDFNGDGQTDIVWRNVDTGRVIVWLMNGVTRIGTLVVWT